MYVYMRYTILYLCSSVCGCLHLSVCLSVFLTRALDVLLKFILVPVFGIILFFFNISNFIFNFSGQFMCLWVLICDNINVCSFFCKSTFLKQSYFVILFQIFSKIPLIYQCLVLLVLEGDSTCQSHRVLILDLLRYDLGKFNN